MQPLQICFLSGRWFEEAFDNTQRRKVKQMQAVWLCIIPGRQFLGTLEKAWWRKISVINVTIHPHRNAFWRDVLRRKTQWMKLKQNYVVSAFGRWGCCIATFSWHAMDTVDIADIQIDIHPSVGQGGAMLCWGSEKLVGKNGSNYWKNYTLEKPNM